MDMPDSSLPAPPCLADDLKEIRDTVDRIHTALIGNDLGQKGIIPRLADAEKKLEEHDRQFLRWAAVISAVGVLFVVLKDTILKALGLK
jgi:hypothetical protein